jgi:hypothetical protein
MTQSPLWKRWSRTPRSEKVIVVLDRVYAEKADDRRGGVGTETQIITPHIYKNVDQNKFVGVISEVNPEGTPYLPTFYSSRIYIDLSRDELFTANFDQLLRWAFDKPAFPKPALGRPPEFLNEQTVLLPTLSKANRAIDLLRLGAPKSSVALQDYLDAFTENLESLRLQPQEGVEFDELVFKSIEAIKPYRDQFISVITALAKSGPDQEDIAKLKRFFEQLVPFLFRPEHVDQYFENWFDNYRFIVHEFLLYMIAILIKQERFSSVDEFVTGGLYVGNVPLLADNALQPITILQQAIPSLATRSQRLGLNRLSLHADLVKGLLPIEWVIFLEFECDSGI